MSILTTIANSSLVKASTVPFNGVLKIAELASDSLDTYTERRALEEEVSQTEFETKLTQRRAKAARDALIAVANIKLEEANTQLAIAKINLKAAKITAKVNGLSKLALVELEKEFTDAELRKELAEEIVNEVASTPEPSKSEPSKFGQLNNGLADNQLV